jgi:hypothetical protein
MDSNAHPTGPSIDRRIAEVVHRLLLVAEDLLDCALSAEQDLQGFLADYTRTRKGKTVAILRIPAHELIEAVNWPGIAPVHPVPVTRKEACELLLRLSQDCRGSGRTALPIAPNPEFMAEVNTLMSRLPADLFDRDNQD